MAWLERMAVGRRLALMVTVAFMSFAALIGLSGWTLYDELMAKEKHRLENVVDAATSVFTHFQGLESAGQLSRKEAQAQAIALLRGLRFDGDNYLFIYDTQGVTILSPSKPETEGQSMAGKTDPDGFPIFDRIAAVARSGQSEMLEYRWNRIGSNQPAPKASFVRAFKPWGWAYGSGVYLDASRSAILAALKREALLAGLLVGVSFVLALAVKRSIEGQLGGEPSYAMDVMEKVAGGDFSVEARPASGARSLLASLGGMVSEVRRMIATVGGHANDLADQSRTLGNVAREVSRQSSSQADATASIAAAVEEMTVSINHIADGARETEQNSLRAVQLSEDGERRAESAVAEMQSIAETVDRAAGTIQQLLSRADEIGSIANVIKEIAAQTNLLALNAAIEAARAGEQGRGFAVVADEVRGLAERTATATVQIEQMILGIQGDTQGAVTVMSSVATQVKDGVGLVESAAESLREIRAGTDGALQRIRDVAEATKEQSAASTSIAQQVEHIAQKVEGTHVSMEAAVHAVEALEGLAAGLKGATDRFRY